jgi:Vitamin K epoxide reductase family/Thioredoxin/Peptidase C39 family
MLNQFDPTVQGIIKFLRLLNVNVTNSTVNECLQNHPDWPSFLCISDTLNKWNIANGAGSLNPSELERLPTPFLARIKNDKAPLVIVTDVTEQQVTLYDGNFVKPRTSSRLNFVNTWTGIYLFAEPNADSGEPQFAQRRHQQILKRFISVSAMALLVGLFAVLTQRLVPPAAPASAWLSTYGQLLLLAAGTVVAIALLWYDIDKNNPLLKRVCTNLVKSGCNAILSSQQAKFLPWLSWSEVGFIYFTGGLLSYVLAGREEQSMIQVVAWMNIIALPYTLFSVYYQWRVARQWCALCLCVQALLVLGALNAVSGGMLAWQSPVSLSGAVLLAICYALPTLVWFALKPVFLSLHEAKDIKRQHLRLKFNSELFGTLLRNQKRIAPVEHLGITLGNPNATHTLVKVCSPYCSPCSKAHPEIEKLLAANANLRVKIIFLAPNPEFNRNVLPISHILAIASQADAHKLHQALDDWYLPKEKDYDLFAARYPMPAELLEQREHLVAMNAWCEQEGIGSTPTVFLDGHQLPSSYNIEDLHYLLLDLSQLAHQVN